MYMQLSIMLFQTYLTNNLESVVQLSSIPQYSRLLSSIPTHCWTAVVYHSHWELFDLIK